ncbi:MAG: hypothetical protein KatS3mg003_0767 [Candidatus Nitrosocaldaceae archaeon]|nr:MAG: hypothetical protein KatS3mg003_0767 [Candidatus Nitrosocaldaceae archaeon]
MDNVRFKKMFEIRPISNKTNENTVDVNRYRVEVQSRVLNALTKSIKFEATLERSENYLRKRVNSKISLVVFYIDLVNSTMMSSMLPIHKLATIIQTFSQEMTFVINNYSGYVLKYVGDAVLGYFPTEKNYYLACDTAIECSKSALNIIKYGINPILEDHGYPELQIKIGMDVGEHAVIQYGIGSRSHVDIIGYPISMAAKITELAKPNQILISNNVYQALHPRLKKEFYELDATKLAHYLDYKGEAYKVYATK